jgi:LAO/AO transport system kinase
MNLADSVLAGDRLSLARLLSHIENGTPEGRQALASLFPNTGQAHLVGVTGAPGTGKSSLVNQLAQFYRHPMGQEAPRRVAVIAVDPSSPFTGGAILGDRIRMRDLAGDPGVFIRSMASRGALGGLAAATSGAVQAFDAAGYDTILIETVGAGQAEVDIAALAHTTLVVEAPGLGDEIQAIKAGILEIADILVVNKADRPGVENTERALRGMLELAHPVRRPSNHHHAPARVQLNAKNASGPEKEADPGPADWIPPVLRTVSTEGAGIPELASQISRHAAYLRQTGDWERREQARLSAELEKIVHDLLFARWQSVLPSQVYQETLSAVFQRRLSPQQAAQYLTDNRTGKQ